VVSTGGVEMSLEVGSNSVSRLELGWMGVKGLGYDTGPVP
jgi:hypothetical protein